MRKSTIFISAVLTTFALIMLYRVAAAYNGSKNVTNVAAAAAAAPTSLPAPAATEAPAVAADPATTALGPVDAAQLAAKVVGNANLASSESSNYNGVNAYKITFTNNDVVYVGLDGQILSVQSAPAVPAAPVVVSNVPAPVKQHRSKGGGGGSYSAPGVSSHSDDSNENHSGGHDD